MPLENDVLKRATTISIVALIFTFAAVLSGIFVLKLPVILCSAVFVVVLAVCFGICTGIHMNAVKKFRKENQKQSEKAVVQMCNQFETLAFKATSLNESYIEQKNLIESLRDQVKNIVPLTDIGAAKIEQDIICKITMVSSLCDSVIAGNDGTEFVKQVQALEVLVKQRSVLK